MRWSTIRSNCQITLWNLLGICFLFYKVLYLHNLKGRGLILPPFFNTINFTFLASRTMQDVEKRVVELIQEKIADREDLFIVSVKMHPNKILEILLDGDNGVNIDDCAQVSRHVGYHLEEENVVDNAYRLEVSSPGIDANFVNLRQYQKNIGRTVQVKLNDNTKVEGKLTAVDDTKINVLQKIKEKGKKVQEVEKELPFDQIKATKVVISF